MRTASRMGWGILLCLGLGAMPADATPVGRLTVASGFRVDLVHSSDAGREGSWVSLCAGPEGQLYASGQYDEGLFRITLPPAGKEDTRPQVQRLPVDLSGAQGLCWAFDSLYALVSMNARTPSGLYRVRDTDGDGLPDRAEQLRALDGGGDHGWHGILPTPDGKALCVVAGNNTRSPDPNASRVPIHWGEDHLLPRPADAGGHMRGVLAPGGAVYRVSPDGRDWEMLSMGFRNPYDAAFSRDGELFTYDADMEWDIGTPWYRPTRICLAASGADFGWRNGAGKWPAHQPDSLPGVLDVGPGSPTGVTFGHGTRFPGRYREALFAADWTFGRIHAVHLRPEGSAYRGESEVLVSGVPLPVVDLAVNPADGALYFITGGWRIQTGLYRVTWTGAGADDAPGPEAVDTDADLRRTRQRLEAFHGRRDPAAVDAAWPFLGHGDRFLRFAARVALEWQDPASWRERALSEPDPAIAVNALTALIRVSGRDPAHRKTGDPAPDPRLAEAVLAALERTDRPGLPPSQQLAQLRAWALCLIRLGTPEGPAGSRLLRRLEPRFPTGNRAVDSALCEILVHLQSPRIARAAMERVRTAATQEEQLDHILSLRMLRTGWTPELRREYFRWFHRAAGYRGGASFAGFLREIRTEALATVPEQELPSLREVLEAPQPVSPTGTHAAELAGRTRPTDWTVSHFAPDLDQDLTGRDTGRGRRMFAATGCFLCHRVGGEGGAVGPDLTRVAGRFGPRDLLESILEPDRTVSDLYGNVDITLGTGESLTGRIVYHLHDNRVVVSPSMFDPTETVTVDRKDIVRIEPSSRSPMPAGLVSLLTRDEVLDLVAFLIHGATPGDTD